MSEEEIGRIKFLAGIYEAKINHYLNGSFPGATLNDPLITIVKLVFISKTNTL